MRIAQIAPIWERVPPPGYGGTEAVVAALTDALVARGHEVVLFASGDSRTSAVLRSIYPESMRTATTLENLRDKLAYETLHAAVAIAEAGNFDIVHNHAGESVAAMAIAANAAPVLSTFHCLITRHTLPIWQRYSGYYNTISHSAAKQLPVLGQARLAGVVYNGIDVAAFPFVEQKQDYLLHLSRIAPDKGTHLAIAAARQAGARLVIAGKVDPIDGDYFEQVVEPLLREPGVEFLGEVSREQSKQLFSQARALLLPLQWEEPFGLVMPEALACGTPVIAFRRGAAPEIIRHGETGFLVDDLDGMVAAIERVGEISPAACRADIAARFDVSVMVEGYEAVYRRILAAETRDRESAVYSPVHPERSAVDEGGLLFDGVSG